MVGRRALVPGLALGLLLAWIAVEHAPAEARGARSNLPPGWTWPPSPATRAEGRRCLEDLRHLGIRFERARRQRLIATPVIVPDMQFGAIRLEPTYRKPPFVMDCRLARELARRSDDLAAIGVRTLHFSSIHDVRRVRLGGKVLGSLSRHSLGLAIDVFEISLASGARLVVKDHYWSSFPIIAAEMVLRASGAFRAILSPAVDPSHHDHLHLEVQVEPPPEHVVQKAAKKRAAKKKAAKKRAAKKKAAKKQAAKSRAAKKRAAKDRARKQAPTAP
jgi:hypothetical protein